MPLLLGCLMNINFKASVTLALNRRNQYIWNFGKIPVSFHNVMQFLNLTNLSS